MTLLTLVVGGTALIGVAYGAPQALLGFLCLPMGGGLILALWLLLTAIEKAVE